MSKHTPGPWKFKIDECWLIEANKESIMGNESYYPWVPKEEADWHLIAAAPELLDACRLSLSCIGVMFGKEADVIRRAIKKATGENNEQ